MNKLFLSLLLFLFLIPGETLAQCVSPITVNTSVSDSWDSACASTHSTGRYARYYTFTLLSTRELTIYLESSVDTNLFLLYGSDENGTLIASNDDISGNNRNSRIIQTLAAGTYTVEATTYEPATTGDFTLSVGTSAGNFPFLINTGLNDAWYNPATNGQGFLITVYPVSKMVFVAWFTFDTERPPRGAGAALGEPGHRWLTAQGPFNGKVSTLTIYQTEGGVFDAEEPPASTDQAGIGTMILEFVDCAEGLITYEITSLDISGEIPIQRIVQENVPACEMILEELNEDP